MTPELLAIFAEPGFEPVTVTIAGLVTVRMDARFQVLDVSLQGRDVEPRQVEAALREAFNEALRQVAQRNATRLTELTARDSKTDSHTAN